MKYNVSIGLIWILILVSCDYLSNNKRLKSALDLAGDNEQELMKVIGYYHKNEGKHSEKAKAAEYLVRNCFIHYSNQSFFVNKDGSPVPFYPPDYGTVPSVLKAKDSLAALYRLKRDISYDCRELKAKWLIEYIDTAFSSWKSAPWAEKISFSQFCKYILPYRMQSEPLSDWSLPLQHKYLPVLDTLSNRSIVYACTAINNAIATEVSYNHCWVGGLGTQSVLQVLKNKGGMCDDLAVFGVGAMRSCGIPATIDFTVWGKINLGHAWCVIFDEDGKAWSFGPGEQNPGEHIKIFSQVAHRKLAKVFRKTYEFQSSSLAAQVKNLNKIPPLFRQLNIMDVTHEYTPVYDLSVPISSASGGTDYVYICVYNKGNWKPVEWATPSGKQATFRNMGDDLLYLVGYFNGMDIVPLSPPFIFDKNQHLIWLNEEGEGTQDIGIDKFTRGIGSIIRDKQYQLYCWEKDTWNPIYETFSTNDSTLILKGLSEKLLYRFENNSRPFTVNNGEVVWW
jgi:hypothetical protein